jgi:hypothetical protein
MLRLFFAVCRETHNVVRLLRGSPSSMGRRMFPPKFAKHDQRLGYRVDQGASILRRWDFWVDHSEERAVRLKLWGVNDTSGTSWRLGSRWGRRGCRSRKSWARTAAELWTAVGIGPEERLESRWGHGELAGSLHRDGSVSWELRGPGAQDAGLHRVERARRVSTGLGERDRGLDRVLRTRRVWIGPEERLGSRWGRGKLAGSLSPW